MQTVIWNDVLGCYTFFGWDKQSTPGSIATITNVDSLGNVIDRVTKPYGLINDAIFYPVDNTILFTGSNSGSSSWAGKIIKLNATDFSVIDAYNSGVLIPYEIGFDATNNIIYVAGKKIAGTDVWEMSILDTSFNVLKNYDASVEIPPYTNSGNGFTYEGSCMIDGQFVIQTFNNDRTILSSYNLENGHVKNNIVVPRKRTHVPENAFVKDGFLFIACYDSNNLMLDKYSLDIIDPLSYVDGQAAFFHQQLANVSAQSGSNIQRVLGYVNEITFTKGVNIVEVREPNDSVRGVFLMTMSNSLYGGGIFVGYYTDYVFKVMLVNGVWSAKQLSEEP